MPTTEELVKSARGGEKASFGALVRLYERAAIVTAYAILRDYHAAQDAAQEAFLNAYANLDQLRNSASFGPWILQAVRRRALLAQKARRPEPIAVSSAGGLVGGGPEEWIQRYEDVVARLAQLPEHDRTVIVLRYLDGLLVQEIADTTGQPADTIRKRLSRALQRLRTSFQKVRP
jgi:RNA polymerase sigma-70 factor, ECF subfamily